VLIAASLAAICALAITASSALAWTPENGGSVISGTLTVKKGGAEAKTCTFAHTFGELSGGDDFSAFSEWYGLANMTCGPSSGLQWSLRGNGLPQGGGAYKMLLSRESVVTNGTLPWAGAKWSEKYTSYETGWNNATESTASNVVLSEAPIGVTTTGQTVTASGTIYFNTFFPVGGKLTLP